MLGNMFLWLVANLKQGVIYFIKQACGNDILASVYLITNKFILKKLQAAKQTHKRFYPKTFLILYPSLENSTTGIAIMYMPT